MSVRGCLLRIHSDNSYMHIWTVLQRIVLELVHIYIHTMHWYFKLLLYYPWVAFPPAWSLFNTTPSPSPAHLTSPFQWVCMDWQGFQNHIPTKICRLSLTSLAQVARAKSWVVEEKEQASRAGRPIPFITTSLRRATYDTSVKLMPLHVLKLKRFPPGISSVS